MKGMPTRKEKKKSLVLLCTGETATSNRPVLVVPTSCHCGNT